MIWMAVSADKYELPIAVEVSASNLAKKMGSTEETIKSRESRKCSGRYKGYKVVKVKEE